MPDTSPNGTVATPSFSPEGDLFNSPQQVEISCATADAVIRYTTDGTVPTEESAAYSGAIPVDAADSPITITARAFLTSMKPSLTAVQNYSIDDSAPVIGTGVYGWAKDTGWAVRWPAPESDIYNVVFSMSSGGETVEKSIQPGLRYGFIAADEFTAAPSPYAHAEITDIRLIFNDTAGNSTTRVIEKYTAATVITPVAGYYLVPQSALLSAAGSTAVYYTINGGNPDMDANLYSDSVYISGSTQANVLRAAGFSTDAMNFEYGSATINIDSVWDDSFVFNNSSTEIGISWTEPYAASITDRFTDITLGFERISNGGTDSAVFVPADADAHTFNNTSAIFSSGEAYNISISARDEAGTVLDGIDVYEDVYIRDGIILTAGTDADRYPLSINGSGSPWAYAAGGSAGDLFTAADTVGKSVRSVDGSMMYFISGGQLRSYDFTAAPPVLLSASGGEVIDFTLTGTGDLLYLAAADPGATSYNITTLTPGTPSTEVVEYTFAPPAASIGNPVGIELFDAANIVVRYTEGVLSTHTYPAAGAPAAVIPVAMSGISGAVKVFGTAAGCFYASLNADGEHTDIFKLTALSPAAGTRLGDIEHTSISFHDISAGGANIIFSATDYRHYHGERLYVYNTTGNDVIEIMELTGSVWEGLGSAAW